MLFAVILIVGLLVLAVVFVVSIYNGLVTARNRYENAYSQIDVQLKRRYDLIPNLVEVAKGYMKHESETLERVIAARNQAFTASRAVAANPGDPKAMQSLLNAEGALTAGLGRLMMVSEQYPDLKADQQMGRLMEELTGTENRVSFARQAYNDAVTLYNTAIEKFPAVLIAGPFNFRRALLFEIEDATHREAPKVSFS